ncbi:MAG: 3-methyl-2-oxobutanoate dehydrogenase subunit beta [Planctomycetota bacterium]|nr:MAG: 3-methyl-2-oxobutanoate dehydrogenase subunit beta [Planctomycetota bacterium]
MGKKILMKGNEALGEGAMRAGMRHYFGYPITPQSEVAAYLSKHLPKRGGVFLQAESEISAINMVYGAASAGRRVMTSSSSPGISLKMEGLSYLVGSELPCLIGNVMRGGPGLGNIAPAQADYFQAVKGGGHGDYHIIVLAPTTCQEMFDFAVMALNLADKYRNPVMILSDGALGQMMEPVVIPDEVPIEEYDKSWALTGAKDRPPNVVNSLFLDEKELEEHNIKLQEKFKRIEENEILYSEYRTEDAEYLFVAFGLVSRIVHSVVDLARAEGIKAGLLVPKMLWPFPKDRIAELAEQCRFLMSVEMNSGQMVEDVRLAVNGRRPVYFYGRMGGGVPAQRRVLEELKSHIEGGTK